MKFFLSFSTSHARTPRYSSTDSDRSSTTSDRRRFTRSLRSFMRNRGPERCTSSSNSSASTAESAPPQGPMIPCGICKRPYDSNHPETLLKHLGGHFDMKYKLHRCERCQINFISYEDLRTHLHSAAKRNCGFMFEHSEPCTGHHTPHVKASKDDNRFNFCYRLLNWERTQLQASTLCPKAEDATLTRRTSRRAVRSIASLTDLMKMHSTNHSKASELTAISEGSVASESFTTVDILSANFLRAICTGDVELVASFLSAGINIDCVDAFGFGPMHYAAQYGSPQIAFLLVKSGIDINATDRRGKTPLAHALKTKRHELEHLFLAWGAEVRWEDLRAVVKAGNVEGAENLLEWWSLKNRPTENLDPLLIHAVIKANEKMVDALLSNGASALAKQDSGRTALNIAVAAEDDAIVDLLLKHGADPDGLLDRKPLSEGWEKEATMFAEKSIVRAEKGGTDGMNLCLMDGNSTEQH